MNSEPNSTSSTDTGISSYGKDDASYRAAGGVEGIEKLVDAFYHYMDTEDSAQDIRAMHKNDLTEVKKRLSYFLSAWLGGPKLYSQNWGPISIPSFHSQFPIDQASRDAWLHCMQKSIDDQDYADDFKLYLIEQLAVPADRILARQQIQ